MLGFVPGAASTPSVADISAGSRRRLSSSSKKDQPCIPGHPRYIHDGNGRRQHSQVAGVLAMAPRSSASASASGPGSGSGAGTGNKKVKELKRTRSAKKTVGKDYMGKDGLLDGGEETPDDEGDEELVMGPGLSAAQAKMTVKSKAKSVMKNASAARRKGLANQADPTEQTEQRKTTKGRKKVPVDEDAFEDLPIPPSSSRSSSTSSPKNSRSARMETTKNIFLDDVQDNEKIDLVRQMSSDDALRKSAKTTARPPIASSRSPQFDQDDDKDFIEFLEKKSKARSKTGVAIDEFEDEEDILDALDEEEGFFSQDEGRKEPPNTSTPSSGSKRKLPIEVEAKKAGSRSDPIRSSLAAVADVALPPSVLRKGGASSISFDKYFDDDLDFNPSFRDGRVMPSHADGMESDVEYFQDDNEFDDPLESSQIVDQDDFVAPAKTRKLSGRKTISDFVDDDIDVDQEEVEDDIEFDEDLDEDEFEDDLEEDEEEEEEEEAGFGVDEYFDDEDESEVSESDADILDELDEEDDQIAGRGIGFGDDMIIEDDSPSRASSGRSRNISAYAYEDADLSDLDQAELSEGFDEEINDEDDDADALLDGNMDEDGRSSRKAGAKKKNKKVTAPKKTKAKSPKAAPKKRGRRASSMSSDDEQFVPVLSDVNQMLRSVIKHDARPPNDLDDDEVPSLDSYNEYDAYEEQVLNDMDQLNTHRRASHVWELNDDMYVTIVDAADSNLWLDGDEENFDALRQSVRKALMSQNPRPAPEGSSQWLGTKMFEAAFDAHYTEMFAWTNDFKEAPPSICDLFPPSQPAPPRLKITTLFSDVRLLDQGDLPKQTRQPAMASSYDDEVSTDVESQLDEDDEEYLDVDVGSDELDEDDSIISARVATSNGNARTAPAGKTKAMSARSGSNGVVKTPKATTGRKAGASSSSRAKSARAVEEDLYDEDDLEGAEEYLEIEERERVRHAAAVASYSVVKDNVRIKDKEATLHRINVLGVDKDTLVSAVHKVCKRVLKRDLNPDEVTNCTYSSRYYKLTVRIHSIDAPAQAIRDALSKSVAVKSVF